MKRGACAPRRPIPSLHPTPYPPTPLAFTLPPPIPDEGEKRERLVRMKRVALALLIGAVVLYVIALVLEPRFPWFGYVRAAAEASVVGGVADWFAVTALFRHPMGIPIPHTAIVPARKDRIGRALGNFVQQHFLSRDVVAVKLASLRLGDRAARWLAEPEHARTVTHAVASALAGGAAVLRDDDVQAFIDRTAGERLRAVRVAPLLGRVLRLVTAGGRHQELLDEALRLASRVTEENDDIIREKVREQTPWWIPGIVDSKISDRVVSGIGRTLAEVSTDPDHPLRHKFDTAVNDFIDRLQSSPATIARAEELKGELLAHPAVREFSASLWSDVKAKLARYAERPIDAPPGRMDKVLVDFAHSVLADDALATKVSVWIDEAILTVVEAARPEISQLIAQTVSAWDPEETSRRIELQIGRDLQFVRINGTVVGGLVGLLIYSLERLF